VVKWYVENGGDEGWASEAYTSYMLGEMTIIFVPAEEGGYTAFIPEVPGAISEGETIKEAREMVLDALRELTTYRREVALKSRHGAIHETLAYSL
jgi:predicted RNase H-like HicB family nuclease